MSDVRYMKKDDQMITVDLKQVRTFERQGYELTDPPPPPKPVAPRYVLPDPKPGLIRLWKGDEHCDCTEEQAKIFKERDDGWRDIQSRPTPEQLEQQKADNEAAKAAKAEKSAEEKAAAEAAALAEDTEAAESKAAHDAELVEKAEAKKAKKAEEKAAAQENAKNNPRDL